MKVVDTKICQFQDQVHREIDEALACKSDEFITIEDLEKLHLLERCIKETLRMYPTNFLVGRNATSDIKLSTSAIHKEVLKIIQHGF